MRRESCRSRLHDARAHSLSCAHRFVRVPVEQRLQNVASHCRCRCKCKSRSRSRSRSRSQSRAKPQSRAQSSAQVRGGVWGYPAHTPAPPRAAFDPRILVSARAVQDAANAAVQLQDDAQAREQAASVAADRKNKPRDFGGLRSWRARANGRARVVRKSARVNRAVVLLAPHFSSKVCSRRSVHGRVARHGCDRAGQKHDRFVRHGFNAMLGGSRAHQTLEARNWQIHGLLCLLLVTWLGVH